MRASRVSSLTTWGSSPASAISARITSASYPCGAPSIHSANGGVSLDAMPTRTLGSAVAGALRSAEESTASARAVVKTDMARRRHGPSNVWGRAAAAYATRQGRPAL